MTEVVQDLEPTLICLVETHLEKEEGLVIPGYDIKCRSDRTGNSGGVLIAVNKKVSTICVQLKETNEVEQMMCMLIDNQRYRIRIEVIYAPQENCTPNEELKKIYNEIEQ